MNDFDNLTLEERKARQLKQRNKANWWAVGTTLACILVLLIVIAAVIAYSNSGKKTQKSWIHQTFKIFILDGAKTDGLPPAAALSTGATSGN